MILKPIFKYLIFYYCVLSLQQTAGNQVVLRMFGSGIIRTKLNTGKPGDKYEQEADRVADAVDA